MAQRTEKWEQITAKGTLYQAHFVWLPADDVGGGRPNRWQVNIHAPHDPMAVWFGVNENREALREEARLALAHGS
jgi:hypothetical protein